MFAEAMAPHEGHLYMTVRIEDHIFPLRYGYYEESDRLRMDPVVIHPDLKNNPVYTSDGRPIVTAVQIPCEHYQFREGFEQDRCCSVCIHYPNMHEEIAVCQCHARRQHHLDIANKQ